MTNNTVKKYVFLLLLSVFSSALATQYTNFKPPLDIPVGLQNGTLNFSYNWGKGSFYCEGPVASLLQQCLDRLNNTINTATFNGEPIFGTASLTLKCSNQAYSYLSVPPDVIQVPNQWITLAVPQNCG